MNLAIIFLFFVAICHGEVNENRVEKRALEMREIRNKCRKGSSVTTEDLSSIRWKRLPIQYEAQCMLACIYKSTGYLKSDGKLDKEGSIRATEVIKDISAELYEQLKVVTENCNAEVKDGKDECETSLNLYTCRIKYRKKLIGAYGIY